MRASYFKALKKAGIDGMTFHDLRHEAISRFFEDTDLAAHHDRAGHHGAQVHPDVETLHPYLPGRLGGRRAGSLG
jgi:integrase